tara:strand:+ start:402 stop:515 length:114 start_codon:yes stop_codon:yes gene_type:complete
MNSSLADLIPCFFTLALAILDGSIFEGLAIIIGAGVA